MLNRVFFFKAIITLLFIINGSISSAQNVGIRSGNTNPDPSAALDVDFTDKGFLMPRMTATERQNISSPAIGLWVYQNAGAGSTGFYYYTSNGWLYQNTPSQWTTSSSNIYYNTGKVGIGSITAPTYTLSVWASENPLLLNGVQEGSNGDSVLAIVNGVVKKYIYLPGTPENAWKWVGNTGQTSTYNSGSYIGNKDANPLRIRTGTNPGTQRMVLDASHGGVGIGSNPSFDNTNPERLLVDIGGSSGTPSSTANYNIVNARGFINNKFRASVQNNYAGSNASSNIRATANDGDATNYFVNMGINSSAYNSGVMGGPNDAFLYNKGEDLLIGNGSPLKKLKFITGGTNETDNTHMVIDSVGNVAIGTAQTTYVYSGDTYTYGKFIIDGSADTTQNTSLYLTGGTNDVLQLNLKNTSAGNGKNTSSDIVATADNGDDESLYINMGINGASYANGGNALLNGAALAYFYANAKDMYIGNAGSGYPLIFFTTAASDTTDFGTEKMRITASGSVCIGMDTAYIDNSTLIPDTASLSVNGSIICTSYAPQSDRRLKTNIESLDYGLKQILALEPVQYNWVDPKQTTQTQLGLIAQDVKNILPEIVTGDEAKGMLGVDYTKLIPVLINAFETQQQQIEDLKKANEEDMVMLESLLKKLRRN